MIVAALVLLSSVLLPCSAVEVQLVGVDDEGVFRPRGEVEHSISTPHIEVEVRSASIDADANVTFSLEGVVTDFVAGTLPPGPGRLSKLYINARGMDTIEVSLQSSALPDAPWQPYGYRARFGVTIRFPAGGMDAHSLVLETDKNAAGAFGSRVMNVLVAALRMQRAYTIEFIEPPSDDRVDTIRIFCGKRTSESSNDLLRETGSATRVFRGELFWGDVTVTFPEPFSFGGKVDALTAEVECRMSNGGLDSFKDTFEETSPTSLSLAVERNDRVYGPELGKTQYLRLGTPSLSSAHTWNDFDAPIGPDLLRMTHTPLRFAGTNRWGSVSVRLARWPSADGERVGAEWVSTGRDRVTWRVQTDMTFDRSQGLLRADRLPGNPYDMAVLPGPDEENPMNAYFVRAVDPLGILNEYDSELVVQGRAYAIEQRNLDGRFHWYAVDQNGIPVVFSPSSLPDADERFAEVDGFFAAEAKKAGAVVAKKEVKLTRGIKVLSGDADAIMSVLTGITKEATDDGKGFYYGVKDGDSLGHSDNKLETEVLFRLVSRGFTSLIVKDATALNSFLKLRKAIVTYAADFVTPFATDESLNSTFWEFKGVRQGQMSIWGWASRKGKKPTACIDDIWVESDEEEVKKQPTIENRTGCYAACSAVFMQAKAKSGIDWFDDLMKPDVFRNEGRIFRLTGMGIATTDEVVNGFRYWYARKISDYTGWLPGEWYRIANNSRTPKLGLSGENIIYTGGSFETDFEKFKKQGKFWGLYDRDNPILTLEKWEKVVGDWNDKAGFRYNAKSYRIIQP